MKLQERQAEFAKLLGELLVWIHTHPGWAVTLGEAFRTDEQAEINAIGTGGRGKLARLIRPLFPGLADKIANNVGSGIRNSGHTLGVAIDLKFFIGGVYQTKSEVYKPLGEWWEARGGSWGGRFSDGNHFSLEWQGIKGPRLLLSDRKERNCGL